MTPSNKNPFAIQFLIGAAIIPLVFTTETVEPVETVRTVLLSLLTGIGLLAYRKNSPRVTSALISWIVYAAFCVLSCLVAINSGEAIYGTTVILLYSTFFFVALKVLDTATIPSLLRIATILCLLLAIVSLLQHFYIGFGWIPASADSDVFGTMTTKNMLSSFLYLTVPAALWLSLKEHGMWKWTSVASWTLGVLVLAMAQTRAVWLGCVTAGFVFIGLIVLHPERAALWMKLRRTAALSVLGLVACVLAVFVFNLIPGHGRTDHSAAFKAASIIDYSRDSSGSMRLIVWKKSLLMSSDHPLLGVGVDNWKVVLPHYGLSDFIVEVQDGSRQWTHTHNDFLAALCETGVGGAVAYLAIFLVSALLTIRASRRSRNVDDVLLLSVAVGTILGYAVIANFDFPASRVADSIFFILWLAVAGTVAAPTAPFAARSRAVARVTSLIGRFGTPVGVILGCCALFLSTKHFVAETHEKSLLLARMDQDWNRVIDECNKSYDAKLLTLDELSTPIMYYRAEAKFMQNDFEGALQDNREALLAHPNHFYTLNNTGSCYVKLGNFPEAEVFYKKALAISPKFEESLLNLASMKFNQKQYAMAADIIARCDTSKVGSRAQFISRAIRSSLH